MTIDEIFGKTLDGRYKIIKPLGSGGFGDTYLALDLYLPGHPYCVVKHLKPKDPNPTVFPIAKKLFDREAEILYRLGEHDQIPTLYAHFCEDGEFYLVEEFVDGHDLSQEIIPGQPLSEEQTIELLQEILEVLAVVHQHNIIHRDIKPSNIMRRDRDGKLVLIDFGAVKEISVLEVDSKGETTFTIAIGSPGYMPIEQGNGTPMLASDVYAVGMICIQALTGIKPDQLPRTSDCEISWRDHAQVSDSLADALTTMVRFYFKERYQNASEALDALIANRVSPALPPQKPARLSRWAVLVGLAVAAITGIAAMNIPSSPPDPLPESLLYQGGNN